MTEQANIHAIKKLFMSMNGNDKNIFLLIVKEFVRIQLTANNIQFLNTTNGGFINQINNIGSAINNLHFNADDTFILNLSNLFNCKYDLFKIVYNLSKKRKFIDRFTRKDKDLIGNETDFTKLKQLFNYIILLNLINRTIFEKNVEDINDFKLLEQINSINPNAENILKLYLLRSNDTTAFLNAINYDTFSMNVLTEQEKQKIYEIFDLFF